MTRRPWVLPVLLLALALTGAACGGGSSSPSEPGPPNPPPPAQGLSYTSGGPSGSATIFFERTNSGNELLVLDLTADSISGLYGLYFNLTYPTGILDFESATEGSLLGADGSQTSFQVVEPTPGRLVVGATRLGQVGASGPSGVVGTFRFRATGSSGNGALAFSDQAAESQDNRELAVNWTGGTANAIF